MRRKSQPGCNFVARGGIQHSILQQAVVVLICVFVFLFLFLVGFCVSRVSFFIERVVGVLLERETETETEINMASFELPEFVGNGILKDHMDTLLADGWDDVPTLKMMSPDDMDLLHLTQLQRVSNLSLSLSVSLRLSSSPTSEFSAQFVCYFV